MANGFGLKSDLPVDAWWEYLETQVFPNVWVALTTLYSWLIFIGSQLWNPDNPVWKFMKQQLLSIDSTSTHIWIGIFGIGIGFILIFWIITSILYAIHRITTIVISTTLKLLFLSGLFIVIFIILDHWLNSSPLDSDFNGHRNPFTKSSQYAHVFGNRQEL
jgi:hypothetical protein